MLLLDCTAFDRWFDYFPALGIDRPHVPTISIILLQVTMFGVFFVSLTALRVLPSLSSCTSRRGNETIKKTTLSTLHNSTLILVPMAILVSETNCSVQKLHIFSIVSASFRYLYRLQ